MNTPFSNEFAIAQLSLGGSHLAVEEPTLFHISHVTTPAPRNSKTPHDPQIVPLHCSQFIIQHFVAKLSYPLFATQYKAFCEVCANYSHHLHQDSSSQCQSKELCQR